MSKNIKMPATGDSKILSQTPELVENKPATTNPRVVIVGAGFGGLQAARALNKVPVDVTVIDRSNHHLFQPLLYEVATAVLSPADISAPIRNILKKQTNARVILAEVTGVDLHQQRVLIHDRSVPYDYLILATGARHSYFGHDAWEPFAPGLKSIPDATAIRRKILLAFEAAEIEPDLEKQRALMTFVLVGAGPTGVEMSGAIAELAHKALASDFRNIDPTSARIILVEAAPRILTAFPEVLAKKAQRALNRLGVEVRTQAPVEAIDENGVVIAGKPLAAKTVIWTAGVTASPAGKWLGVETDRVGRVKVSGDLTIPDHPNIFVIGDTARNGPCSHARGSLRSLNNCASCGREEKCKDQAIRGDLSCCGRPISLHQQRQRGHSGTLLRCGRNRQIAGRRFFCLGLVACHTHLLPDRLP